MVFIELVQYWFCVMDEENWQIIKNEKIWGVPKRNHKRIKKVEIGDMLVFYMKPKKLVGVCRAKSAPFTSDEKIFVTRGFSEEETFPYRVRIQPFMIPRKPVSFESLIPKMRFIANKKIWPVYLRKAMQSIPKEDYETIIASLRS